MMKVIPKDYEHHSKFFDVGMSNFDGAIDNGFEDILKSGKYVGHHAALDFSGSVWFENKVFSEEVWQFGTHVGTVSANTLKELMEEVNEEYGDA